MSELLGQAVKLVFMPDDSFRQIDRNFFKADQRTSFSDGFPLLLTNQASLDDLNHRLSDPVPMTRFRPNIAFRGDAPFQEGQWKHILIGEIEFAVVKPCSRCIMTTIDDQGNKGKESLKTLATYRRNEFGVCFGQNIVQLNQGVIALGDEVSVFA